MDVYLNYDASFPPSSELRPQVKLEFIARGGARMRLEMKPVTSLIHQFLKDKVNQQEKILSCICVLETAAEKWVAFTRRVATIVRGLREHDMTLVRHLYDLHMLSKQNIFNEEFYVLVDKIIKSDIEQYRNHNPEYIINPVQETQFALRALEEETKWQENWEQFVKSMVFRQESLNYLEALATLNQVSNSVFLHIQI